MTKIESEKRTVEMMIRLYCRKKHGLDDICVDCNSLLLYARKRLEKCVYGENKSACKLCPVHCYNKDRREQIRKVMRYSGPRIFFYFPFEYLKHLKQKRL